MKPLHAMERSVRVCVYANISYRSSTILSIICIVDMLMLIALNVLHILVTCSDGILNQDETDIDCGGATCPACETCSDGLLNQDETDVDCGGVTCPPCETCSDGLLNQDETDVDCGGATCPACETCSDGLLNQNETDVDCGGATCPPCAGEPVLLLTTLPREWCYFYQS